MEKPELTEEECFKYLTEIVDANNPFDKLFDSLFKDMDNLYWIYDKLTWIDYDIEQKINECNDGELKEVLLSIKNIEDNIENLVSLTSKNKQLTSKQVIDNKDNLINKILLLIKFISSDIDSLISWTSKKWQLTPEQVKNYNDNLINFTFIYFNTLGKMNIFKQKNVYYSDIYNKFILLKNKINELDAQLALKNKNGIINIQTAGNEAVQRSEDLLKDIGNRNYTLTYTKT